MRYQYNPSSIVRTWLCLDKTGTCGQSLPASGAGALGCPPAEPWVGASMASGARDSVPGLIQLGL